MCEICHQHAEIIVLKFALYFIGIAVTCVSYSTVRW
jgi:hypothetical protein